MRLWFSPSSEVPIYRQLATQVILAILSNDLRPGDRLRSTRELARRFAVHPNTISAGYRQLQRDGWTEHRRGGGVYVCANTEAACTSEQIIDQHIASFFRTVRELNLPSGVVRRRMEEWLASPPPDHLLIVDPDPEVRQIIVTEIGKLTTVPIAAATPEEAARPENLAAAIPLCRPSKAKSVRAALPSGVELITLKIRSANAWLGPWIPTLKGRLIGVASHWPEFLELGRTMLIAAGFNPEALVFRDARQPRWRRGLDQTTAVICDAFTAQYFPDTVRTLVFPLLADTTQADLTDLTSTLSL